jgi:2'-5' RNA ligase
MTDATQRLFFALWPDASTSDALATIAQQVATESGGRATSAGNVHLTLAFLGDQPCRIARELSVAAARISAPPFDLVFDRVDTWRKSAIVWAATQDVPAPLIRLHESIARLVAASGDELDDRPFAAHVTLARRAEIPVRRRLVPSLTWRVSSFALVASELSAAGARYRVLSSWPLISSA